MENAVLSGKPISDLFIRGNKVVGDSRLYGAMEQ